MGMLDGKVAIVTGAGGGLGREHGTHGLEEFLEVKALFV